MWLPPPLYNPLFALFFSFLFLRIPSLFSILNICLNDKWIAIIDIKHYELFQLKTFFNNLHLSCTASGNAAMHSDGNICLLLDCLVDILHICLTQGFLAYARKPWFLLIRFPSPFFQTIHCTGIYWKTFCYFFGIVRFVPCFLLTVFDFHYVVFFASLLYFTPLVNSMLFFLECYSNSLFQLSAWDEKGSGCNLRQSGPFAVSIFLNKYHYFDPHKSYRFMGDFFVSGCVRWTNTRIMGFYLRNQMR